MAVFRGEVMACRIRAAAVVWDEVGAGGLMGRVEGSGRGGERVDALRLREDMAMALGWGGIGLKNASFPTFEHGRVVNLFFAIVFTCKWTRLSPHDAICVLKNRHLSHDVGVDNTYLVLLPKHRANLAPFYRNVPFLPLLSYHDYGMQIVVNPPIENSRIISSTISTSDRLSISNQPLTVCRSVIFPSPLPPLVLLT